jgi:hypothetical protein
MHRDPMHIVCSHSMNAGILAGLYSLVEIYRSVAILKMRLCEKKSEAK